MKTVGIICEYNPFHNGHAAQLRRIREAFGEDCAVVCLMSGSYVQRGEPAIFPKSLRAEAAVRCGADLVLELPLTASLSSAEGFAAGGVRILTVLGCEALSFGSESGDRNLLMSIARANLDPRFDALLRQHLASGCSYPTARQRALALLIQDQTPNPYAVGAPSERPQSLPLAEKVPPQQPVGAGALNGPLSDPRRPSVLSNPNDILAVEYCKAILRQGSPMQPVPIRRPGSYHAEALDPAAPSATALRAALVSSFSFGRLPTASADPSRSCHCATGAHTGRGNPSSSDWRAAVPSCLHDLYAAAPLHTMEAGERACLAILRTLPDAAFEALPFGAEGLWSKFRKNCRACATVEEILAATKSKRYTLSRLRRMLLCAVLGLSAADLERQPPYVRILAFNDRGRAALREMKAGLVPPDPQTSPVFSLINAGETPPDAAYSALEGRAADLYGLFAAPSPEPPASEARLRVVKRSG